MSRLRSYAPMKRQSDKVKKGAADFKAVYAEVDARSEGRCEVVVLGYDRCSRRAVEHHHLFKPRRAHHTAVEVVHICRQHHDRTEWPYSRGRLCFVGRALGEFVFAIYAAKPAIGERRGGHFA